MAQVITKKRVVIPPTEPDDGISLSELETNAENDYLENADLPDDLAFESIVNELGVSDEYGKVNVYKLQNGNYNDQIFLFDCLPIEFNLSMLQNPEYHSDGHHKFKVILRNSKNIVKAKQISVMPNAKLFEKPVDVKPAGNELADAIKAINDSNQALIAAIMTNKQNVEKPKTTLEFLTEMQMMKEIFGGNPTPPPVAAPQQSPLEVLELAKELARAMNPDANTGVMDTMGRMLEKYAEPVINAIASAPSNKPPALLKPPATNPIPASPHGVTPNPLPSANPQLENVESENQMSIMLKMYLGQLLTQANRNANVEIYADLVLDQVGDAIFPMLEAPDWFEKLVALNPAVAQQKAWFERLREAILYVPDDGDDSGIDDFNLTNTDKADINEVTSNLPALNDESNNTDDANT